MGTQRRDKVKDLALERWYHFFLDACKTAHKLDYGIAVNHEHKQAMMDMMERVAEDELWPHAKSDLPPLVVHRDVPPGQYMFVNKQTMDVLSTRAALNGSRTGLGRFDKLWTPDQGLKRGLG